MIEIKKSKTMKEILDWLLPLERLAGDVYRMAAEKFSKDKEFREFLLDLASDEDEHFRLLKEAEERYLQKKEPTISPVIVDQETKEKVIAPLKNLSARVKSAEKISKQAVLKLIVAVEFAELNNLFQYVINTFQRDGEKIKRIAGIIQEHLDRIRTFLNQHSDLIDLSEVIGKLPTVGKEKLLIVEDKLPLRLYMSQALETFGSTDMAPNGQEALQKVRTNFFNLIISSVNMPEMSGLDFFQRAIKLFPDIGKKFIFCGRDMAPDVGFLCRSHGITFLKIPFGVNHLYKTVREVLDKSQ